MSSRVCVCVRWTFFSTRIECVLAVLCILLYVIQNICRFIFFSSSLSRFMPSFRFILKKSQKKHTQRRKKNEGEETNLKTI